MRFASSLKPLLKWVDGNDLIVAAGLGMVARGIWMIHPPSAWIVVGAVVFIIGVLRSR